MISGSSSIQQGIGDESIQEVKKYYEYENGVDKCLNVYLFDNDNFSKRQL